MQMEIALEVVKQWGAQRGIADLLTTLETMTDERDDLLPRALTAYNVVMNGFQRLLG